MELLSPAGSYKGFMGALNAGCDAVYLGGTRFGARAYAENFTDEEIIKAIEYAHLFGVKIYLTVNTLIKESEFSDVLSYVDLFYKAGLDGCIVQDLGLISVFHDHFPLMECHISTQGFVTGTKGCRLFKALGASRVVLARELSLSEIRDIKSNVDVEIETFIHGAMCYSYSGNCLLSSCLGGRSGNRGRCAGPCRLEYSVIKDSFESAPGYYFSMKDQCALPILPKLLEAGIDSLKIEGRMKKPEYSAFTTYVYRKYMDSYHENKKTFKVSTEDLDNLRHMYLRSDFGTGYYDRENGREMITVGSPAYGGNDQDLMKDTAERFLETGRKLEVSA
ncbi:MAG: U32 family peptidase, partial [Lachnospiraceae bacterium]|nr:U32 family peptidase [Lachnospiraceae bacterium]